MSDSPILGSGQDETGAVAVKEGLGTQGPPKVTGYDNREGLSGTTKNREAHIKDALLIAASALVSLGHASDLHANLLKRLSATSDDPAVKAISDLIEEQEGKILSKLTDLVAAMKKIDI